MIDVNGSADQRFEPLLGYTGPGLVTGGFGRILPLGEDVEAPLVPAHAEGGVAGRKARGRAMNPEERHRGPWRRKASGGIGSSVNEGVAQLTGLAGLPGTEQAMLGRARIEVRLPRDMQPRPDL